MQTTTYLSSRTMLLAAVRRLLNVCSGYGQAYPLKLGTNQRHFVDQNNQPLLINGDMPWR